VRSVIDDARRLLGNASEVGAFSRRAFLTGSSLGLALAADLVLTRRIQEERENLRLLPVPDDGARAAFPHSRWVLFPGYKTSWEEGLWILNSLRPTMARRAQMSVVGYSNRGLDVSNIVAELTRYVRNFQLEKLYFYGHSFGGMVAVEVAARLAARGIPVEIIVLDSSPHTKFDVLEQEMFDGVVFLYEAGYRIPTVVRGGYELGERIAHKNERSWRQVIDQTLEQLSPLAPSSVLIQSQASYIYHFDPTRFRDALGGTQLAFLGNPNDTVVNYATARAGWAEEFPVNLVLPDLVTEGARPAHASPQWNPLIYRELVQTVQERLIPLPRGGGRVTAF
jgi:pimeloyl-ACP methyl ester carboxylesterase